VVQHPRNGPRRGSGLVLQRGVAEVGEELVGCEAKPRRALTTRWPGAGLGEELGADGAGRPAEQQDSGSMLVTTPSASRTRIPVE
jgi:hypothetical protein